MPRPTHSGKTWAGLPEQSARSRMNAIAMNDVESRASTDVGALADYIEAHADDIAIQALAALTPASNKLPYFNGASTGALADLSAYARTILDDADAATARSTLGISVGTNVQAQSTNLQALADLTSAANVLPYFTGSGTAALTTLSSFIRTLLDDADAATVRATLGLIIGTNVQAQDAELQAIAGLTSAADRLPYFTGSGAGALAVFTSFARTLLDDADAATVRATLGLVIGTNVQAQDAELQAIAGLTSAADALPYFTGSGTANVTTLTSFVRTLLDDTTQAAAQTTLGVVPGTNVQAYDADLAALSALTSAANKLPYFTGSGTASTTTLSAFARTLLDDADSATARATLEVEPGVELGYAEITTDATRASTTPADVTGLTVTVTVASRPIIVVFDCNGLVNTSTGGGVRVDILEDGVVIGRASLLGAVNDASPGHREIRRTPSVGSHTYKIQLASLLSGTATIKADTGATAGPAFITVRAV